MAIYLDDEVLIDRAPAPRGGSILDESGTFNAADMTRILKDLYLLPQIRQNLENGTALLQLLERGPMTGRMTGPTIITRRR